MDKVIARVFIDGSRLVTHLFLVVSVLTFICLGYGSSFHREFTIENRTEATIAVTPIGTVGEAGREPLPIYLSDFSLIPAPRRGGFELSPGESINIVYDMDDINFSEIVVQVADRDIGELTVNADSTRRQYHAPPQTHFVIDDLGSLLDVTDPVRDAAKEAQVPNSSPWIVLSMLLGPWIAFVLVSWLNRRFPGSNRPVGVPKKKGD